MACTHVMHGLHLRSTHAAPSTGTWRPAGTTTDATQSRTPTVAKPAADAGGAGRITDLAGTGWTTLALKGVWRPDGAHQADVGRAAGPLRLAPAHRQRRRLDRRPGHHAGQQLPRPDAAAQPVCAGQLVVRPRWKAVLGLRHEHWTASDGAKTTGTAAPVAFAERSNSWLSPKAALGFQARDDWALKLSTGRAVRVPTVGELFQGNAVTVDGRGKRAGRRHQPRPAAREELDHGADIGTHAAGHAAPGASRASTSAPPTRCTARPFAGTDPIVDERAERRPHPHAGGGSGLDLAPTWLRGLDVRPALTYADSVIQANSRVWSATPGDTVGKQQPRVPKSRASLLASYRLDDALTAGFGARYGSAQSRPAQQQRSQRLRLPGLQQVLQRRPAAAAGASRRNGARRFGINNLNNARSWNFHPYPSAPTVPSCGSTCESRHADVHLQEDPGRALRLRHQHHHPRGARAHRARSAAGPGRRDELALRLGHGCQGSATHTITVRTRPDCAAPSRCPSRAGR